MIYGLRVLFYYTGASPWRVCWGMLVVPLCLQCFPLKWLESGKVPQNALAASAYESLYSRQVGKKWSVRINKNTENKKFYVDIRNWADSDIYSRGAFIPMELLPRLLAELNELPNQLMGLGYELGN